jgi:hypothetical protein
VAEKGWIGLFCMIEIKFTKKISPISKEILENWEKNVTFVSLLRKGNCNYLRIII